MDHRFRGRKIFKDDTGIERIVKISFYWKCVDEIESYTYEDHFKNQEPKLFVATSRGVHVILYDYEKFDELLSKFDKERKVIVCN